MAQEEDAQTQAQETQQAHAGFAEKIVVEYKYRLITLLQERLTLMVETVEDPRR